MPYLCLNYNIPIWLMTTNKPKETTMPKLNNKILINKIIGWLNSDIDKDNYLDNKIVQNAIAQNSADLKEKIDLYLDGSDEF